MKIYLVHYPVQSEQDDEQDVKMIFRKSLKFTTHRVLNSERMKTDMTEHQWKELSKWCLGNGQRKLTKEEKEIIKSAIDEADSRDELMKVAFASLAIDSNR